MIKSNSLNISSFGVGSNLNDTKNESGNLNSGHSQQLNKDKRNNKNNQNSFLLFKHSDKPLIKDLLSNTNNLINDDISDSNCQLLENLSKELNFEYCYFPIPVISKSGTL